MTFTAVSEDKITTNFYRNSTFLIFALKQNDKK